MTTYKDLQQSSALESDNAAYIESLYEQFIRDPSQLDPLWRDYFQKNEGEASARGPLLSEVREKFLTLGQQPRALMTAATAAAPDASALRVYQLIQAYRRFGHLQAKIDPLGLSVQSSLLVLDPRTYGLNPADSTLYDADGLAGLTTAPLKTIIDLCQKIYTGPVGFECAQVENPEEAAWLQKNIASFADFTLSAERKKELLKQLTATEGLEKMFSAKFVGVTRFSVEGGDAQIPLLNALIQECTQFGVKEVMIGMAHRGRLNVLVNVLGMPVKDIVGQFEGSYAYAPNHSGDVKYHYGYSADLQTSAGVVHATLAFNPSHLEIISPVVQGSVRAREDRRHDTERREGLAIQLHGDSAFAGQGVVMETFQLSQTRGFKVGGSIHLVVNNQVGFTTSHPEDTRSTRYCTDPAKMLGIPIFHVNSDQPEAVIFVAQLASRYRAQFKKDVVIDLVCYRRYGHNEGDEPSATQPLMYQVIKALPPVRKLYAERLIQEGVISEAEVASMVETYRHAVENNETLIAHVPNPGQARVSPDWKLYLNTTWDTPTKTSLAEKTFQVLAPKITALPEGFKCQAQVARALAHRAAAYEGKSSLIWGDAEVLAYASLLEEGYRVRLVGQDAGRGTFAHRHAVVYDQVTGKPYVTLDHLNQDQAPFTIVDSFLSENAVMGFEYGYSATEPRSLVIWEAQYGDFANGAQVVADQFLSSGEQKWGQLSGLTLLLPHGYEGAGPEHSSSRVERYLQLCAQDNMQVCVPTTPAQIFHLLRRQVLRPYRKPLIVLTPKSLLRKATSTLEDIFSGEFQLLIEDTLPAAGIKKVILCAGKVYYDLLEKREALQNKDIALLRLEQLYPFPQEVVSHMLKKYAKTASIFWCQEEPENQGAWRSIRHWLEACIQPGQKLSYVGRKEAASTAAGYKKLHEKELAVLLTEVFG